MQIDANTYQLLCYVDKLCHRRKVLFFIMLGFPQNWSVIIIKCNEKFYIFDTNQWIDISSKWASPAPSVDHTKLKPEGFVFCLQFLQNDDLFWKLILAPCDLRVCWVSYKETATMTTLHFNQSNWFCFIAVYV